MHKCEFPEGLKILPDGKNELDPCLYETSEIYTNCIVEICRCKKCGNISVSWRKTDQTESVPESDFDMFV